MYGPIILIIIFSITLVIGILSYNLPNIIVNQLDEQLIYDRYGYLREFQDSDWDRDYLQENNPEELKKLRKVLRKRKRISRFDYAISGFSIGVIFISILILTIMITVAIAAPVCANREVAYWLEFKPMAEQIINSAVNSDSSALTVTFTDKVIEYNAWLANARASQDTFSNWSMYYGIDLSVLDYIILN